MNIVHVQVRVKPESIEAFRQATIENARQSVKEPGIARFDVLQDLSHVGHEAKHTARVQHLQRHTGGSQVRSGPMSGRLRALAKTTRCTSRR